MRIAHSLPNPCVITVLMLFSTIITFVPQGSSSTTQDHLCKLFKALESFYHPSNSGRYSVTPNEIKPCHIKGVVIHLHNALICNASFGISIEGSFFQKRDKIVGVHLDRTKGMGGGGSLRSYFMFP